MQTNISAPPLRVPVSEMDADGVPVRVTRDWSSHFTQVFNIVFAQSQAGTTAERPTKGLYVGRRYFDISLGAKGRPIYVDKTGLAWADADGNPV